MSCPICDQWCKMYLKTNKIKVSVVTEKRNEIIHLLLFTKMDKNNARKIQGGAKPSKLMFLQQTFYNRNQFCIIKIWFVVQCCQRKWIKTIKNANCVWEGNFISSKHKVAEKTSESILVLVIYSSNSISLLYTAVCDKTISLSSSLKHHLLILIRNGNRSHKCKRYSFQNWRL